MAKNATSFKPGTGGRKPGAKNKSDKPLRQFITEFLNENKKLLYRDFVKLKPNERFRAFENLLKYSIPPLQSISLTNFDKMTEEQLDEIISHLKASENGQKS